MGAFEFNQEELDTLRFLAQKKAAEEIARKWDTRTTTTDNVMREQGDLADKYYQQMIGE
jgi:hypothetical protein